MLAVGIGALQYVLDKGQEDDWFSSSVITTLSVVAVVRSLLFSSTNGRRTIRWSISACSRNAATPSMNLMTVLGRAVGSLVLLPVMLQTLLGFPHCKRASRWRHAASDRFHDAADRTDDRTIRRPQAPHVGFFIAGLTLLWFSQLNLQAGYWDIFWPQLLQGVGMSLTFVPLTTVAMDQIPRERMGNATSLFNLMRNIGGSVGIATTGTLLARHQQATTQLLGSNVTAYDPQSQAMLAQMRAAFMAAAPSDRKVVFVRPRPGPEPATMVSFVGIFQLLGFTFLGLIPLVLLMKRPKGRPARGAH
jgi:DHA2 family multidrug resistance protein